VSREQSHEAIIIKKTPFGEADEIISFFTEQAGKLRALAKSVKLGKSKLQQSLQPIFLNRVELAGSGNLPKVIGVQTLNAFQNLQAAPERVAVWFVIAELLNKALPDGQSNPELFKFTLSYLEFLNTENIPEAGLRASLVKFKIRFLELIGLEIHAPLGLEGPGILFSPSRGGFYQGSKSSDSRPITSSVWQAFLFLRKTPFSDLVQIQESNPELAELINDFLTYQLEREIKANRFLKT
jgi:DNA repair protein RecO (recombination protein O)